MMITPLIWKLSGNRSEVPLEEVEDLEFPEDSSPHEIDISCRVWRASVLQAIPFPVERMASAKILKADDITATLETEVGLETLGYVASFFSTHSPGLEQVDLKDNAVGTRGIEALQPLFTLKNLTHLNLKNTGIAEADALKLKEILNTESLLSLDFSRNNIGPEGARHFGELISRCTNLQSFSYAGTRDRSEGIVHVCAGLSGLHHIVHLNLEDCNVGNADLTPCLRNSTKLEYLNLDGNGIGLEKLAEILGALESSSLVYLNLSGNEEFGSEGGELLKAFLQNAPRTLRTLKLDSCFLGSDGVRALIEGLRDGHMVEELDLGANDIEDTAMFLPPLKGLKTLNLQDNFDMIDFERVATELVASSIKFDVDEDVLEELGDELTEQLNALSV